MRAGGVLMDDDSFIQMYNLVLQGNDRVENKYL